MINLLPPAEKKYLEEDKRLKIILVLGVLFLAFLISFSLILTVIRMIIFGQLEIQKSILEQKEKEFQQFQIKEFEGTIKEYNKLLLGLNVFYQQQFNFADIFEKISKILPDNTYLTNIFLDSQKEEDGKILLNCNISGFSKNRENLLQFRNNLEQEEEFRDIYFPPSNWISSSDINFSINFKIIHEH